MKRNRGSIVAGIFLVGLGGWLLAQQLGVWVPGLSQLWPGLVVLGGAAALLAYVSEREPDQLFLGVAGVLVGGCFFLFTLGRLDWQADMPRYWPAFLIIFSLASVAQWLAAPDRRGYLVQAGVSLLVGLFFFAYYFNLLSGLLVRQVQQLWPLLLIVAGLIALARSLRRTN